MRLAPWIAAGGLTFALCALPLFGQPGDKPIPAAEGPKSIKLPLTRVVLFNAGIGYFERSGTVDGPSKLALKVNEEDINDLILTLMVNDPNGTARAVTYDNRAPAEITLKAFSIDLTENPTVGALLLQVRGEKVEITEMGGTAVSGSIVSVIKPETKTTTSFAPGEEVKNVTVTPDPMSFESVSLLTDDGLQTVSLAKVKKVKFTKPELQAEFRLALEALAAARGAATKSVGVTFPGKGSRKVSVGYVSEAPLWKPTYRLTLGDAAPKLIGLAAVENTTDEDWENVKVKLVSGRPMTFQMDLYDPLFIPRPLVEQELYASLKPPVYQGPALQMMGGNFGFGGGGQFGQGGGFGQQGGGNNLGVGGGVFGMVGFQVGGYGSYSGGLTRPSVRSLLGERLDLESFRVRELERREYSNANPAKSSDIPASANLGEAFEYSVLEPVSLPRFKSALLPILNEPLEIERISLYTKQVLPTHPLKGLRLKNTSKQYIAQGPVTVFEGDTVAGQARLADLKPGDSRLLSYAIDLDVAMTAGEETTDVRNLSVKIVSGELRVATRRKTTVKYTAFNKNAEARTIWITQTRKPDWKLLAPAKPAETTADLQRFELKVAAGQEASLEVIEEREMTEFISLQNLSDSESKRILKMEVASPAIKEALGKIRAALSLPEEIIKALAEEGIELTVINEAQARMRSNLAVADKSSDIYKRYLKKFDDQETEIEKRQAKIKELTKTKEKLAKEFKAMVEALNAE